METRVRGDRGLLEVANQRKGPYERFIKGMRPFAHYCGSKCGLDSVVLCYLTDREVGDAFIEDPETGRKRLVEITFPIDGKELARQKKLLFEGGLRDQPCSATGTQPCTRPPLKDY